MRWKSVTAAAAAAVALAAIAVAVMASGSTSDQPSKPATAPKAKRLTPRQVTAQAFSHKNFSQPWKIDNKWLPLVPGTQYVYEGRSTRTNGRLPHRIIFTVTDLTKVVYGLRTLVIWDRDINGGRLVEEELAFHAQDDSGNIWMLGQYAEEYEGRKFIGAPSSWIVGRAHAKPGLHLPGNPQPGTPAYSQGYAPAVAWGDIAKVMRLDAKTCVPIGCFKNVLETDETNPLEPGDGHQRKFYAAGIGNVRAAPGKGDKEQEAIVLTKVRHLSAKELAAARKHALVLDKRAYRVKKRLYRGLAPAQRIK